jgi:hypothetical protein
MPDQTADRKNRLDDILKVAGVVVTLGGFLWGIWTYVDTSKQQLAREQKESAREIEARRIEDARQAQTRRIEATKPYLERQLTLYTQASQVTSTLAISDDEQEKAKMRKRFWQLYWGELALVEDKAVERAMVAYGQCLTTGCDSNELRRKSLALAHACRDSLAVSWDVEQWKTPRGE